MAASTRAGSSGTSIGALVTTATRRPAGARAAEAAKASAGGGAHEASPVSVPASRSRARAVSPTVRVSTPSTARKLSPVSGASELRLRWGLRPTRPQQAAGMRVERPRLGVRDRHHAGRDGRRRAAQGASAGARRVPRVARRPEALGVGPRQDAPLRQAADLRRRLLRRLGGACYDYNVVASLQGGRLRRSSDRRPCPSGASCRGPNTKRFGPTRNPWDPTRTSGGSLGRLGDGRRGPAWCRSRTPTTAAARPRIPAACCGLVGLKPQRNRISLAPETGESFLAVDGVLTRTVGDTALALDLLAGTETGETPRGRRRRPRPSPPRRRARPRACAWRW